MWFPYRIVRIPLQNYNKFAYKQRCKKKYFIFSLENNLLFLPIKHLFIYLYFVGHHDTPTVVLLIFLQNVLKKL